MSNSVFVPTSSPKEAIKANAKKPYKVHNEPHFSCYELCGREKPCGNTYCSNNPKYTGPVRKTKKKAR